MLSLFYFFLSPMDKERTGWRAFPHTEILNRDRTTFGPVRRDELKFLESWKQLCHNAWPASDIEKDLPEDRLNFPNIDVGTQRLLKHVLAFFANADAIVADMAMIFYNYVSNPVINAFWGEQIGNEKVHQEAYTLMVEGMFAGDDKEIASILSGRDINGCSAYLLKLEWSRKWLEAPGVHPCAKLIAFGASEGIQFSASFAAIFWVKNRRGCHLPGMFIGNELVMQDENMHFMYTVAIFRILDPRDRISTKEIHAIVSEAVETEDAYVDEAIPKPMLGMNASLMKTYVRWVADLFLEQLGVPTLYDVKKSPFSFMDLIWQHGRVNPFERRSKDYGKLRSSSGMLRVDSAEKGLKERLRDLSRSYGDSESGDSCSPSEDDEGDDENGHLVQEEGPKRRTKFYGQLEVLVDF